VDLQSDTETSLTSGNLSTDTVVRHPLAGRRESRRSRQDQRNGQGRGDLRNTAISRGYTPPGLKAVKVDVPLASRDSGCDEQGTDWSYVRCVFLVVLLGIVMIISTGSTVASVVALIVERRLEVQPCSNTSLPLIPTTAGISTGSVTIPPSISNLNGSTTRYGTWMTGTSPGNLPGPIVPPAPINSAPSITSVSYTKPNSGVIVWFVISLICVIVSSGWFLWRAIVLHRHMRWKKQGTSNIFTTKRRASTPDLTDVDIATRNLGCYNCTDATQALGHHHHHDDQANTNSNAKGYGPGGIFIGEEEARKWREQEQEQEPEQDPIDIGVTTMIKTMSNSAGDAGEPPGTRCSLHASDNKLARPLSMLRTDSSFWRNAESADAVVADGHTTPQSNEEPVITIRADRRSTNFSWTRQKRAGCNVDETTPKHDHSADECDGDAGVKNKRTSGGSVTIGKAV
jgi:hypothetical protein